jgi:hypothetical protein
LGFLLAAGAFFAVPDFLRTVAFFAGFAAVTGFKAFAGFALPEPEPTAARSARVGGGLRRDDRGLYTSLASGRKSPVSKRVSISSMVRLILVQILIGSTLG